MSKKIKKITFKGLCREFCKEDKEGNELDIAQACQFLKFIKRKTGDNKTSREMILFLFS